MRYIPIPIKIILSIAIFPLFIIVWAIACSREMSKTLETATRVPNEQNVAEMVETWNRIKLAVNNHPNNWKNLRNSWYRINGSDMVPTYLKQQTIDIFQKKGLFINNPRIIDNYRK